LGNDGKPVEGIAFVWYTEIAMNAAFKDAHLSAFNEGKCMYEVQYHRTQYQRQR
jgi:hypothetical protein